MDRSLPRGTFQLKAILKTFAISAFFHGFYIGYYLFFGGLFLLDFAWKLFGNTALVAAISKKVPEKLARLISVGLLQLELRYLTITFALLTWANCLDFFKAFYAFGTILPIMMIVLGLVLPKARREKK